MTKKCSEKLYLKCLLPTIKTYITTQNKSNKQRNKKSLLTFELIQKLSMPTYSYIIYVYIVQEMNDVPSNDILYHFFMLSILPTALRFRIH